MIRRGNKMVESIKKENDVNQIISNNSEILFIYDAKMCNPNGDPDDENKPRMDYDRSVNLVSDLRLKRYIRDYLMDYKNQVIFVRKIDKANVNAKKSLSIILGIEDKKQIEIADGQVNDFLKKATDVRMFGSIIPDVKFESSKSNTIFTGPIQFNWGYSLNKITGPMDSNGITSQFQTGKTSEEEESTKGSGAMGKDFRVAYSIIAFHGIISSKRAEYTFLTNNDLKLFDEAMIKAIPLEATTRSKTGQSPLMYIRIEYNNPEFFIGDLRRYVKLTDQSGNEITFDNTSKLSSPKEYKLDISELKKKLEIFGKNISQVHFWKHEDMNIHGWNLGNDGKLKYEVEENGKKEEKTIEIKDLAKGNN